METPYSVVGRTIHPGMSVNIFLERKTVIGPCPGEFRAVAIETGSAFMHDLFWIERFVAPDPRDRLIRLGPGAMERANALLDRMDSSLAEQSDGFWPCRSRSYFLEFLFHIRAIGDGVAPDDEAALSPFRKGALPEKLEDILLHVHAHFCDDIDLSGLCRKFAINRTSLNALFKEHTGKTAIQYLIELRVRFARLLLRDTTVPVKELAGRCGFNDLVHFTRTFKKGTSMTPLEYRREYCSMLA